ncbi:hypothetical protein SAMN04487765_2042 [Tenacibaculum sp. MAR_2010_89]|uniref:hypothetical protein n=1 Tax=Tenacibaculum sp. MAR_2010_89 TaxID=1250198 RepID=UPI000894AB62|nr:hypothetical protein [Tenacibaculum sp. MAR_2010_89]SEE29545.1 hypothetical protein SAMN04487765_2042 [Tenacibaculum sp. MAR_2010_89]
MKINIKNIFNKDIDNDLYFISYVSFDRKLNKGDVLNYKGIKIGEVIQIESEHNNNFIALINFFGIMENLKISELYNKDISVISSNY